MASPIGHSLFALVGADAAGDSTRSRWAWFGFGVLAANVADLDFAAGMLVGDVNRYHRSVSHSLGAVLVFGACTWVATYVWRKDVRLAGRAVVVGVALYLIHLVLDALSQGLRGLPSGQPLYWPLSSDIVFLPWAPIPGLSHGGARESLTSFLSALTTWDNLGVLVLENLILIPVAGAAALMVRLRRRRRASSAAS